MTKLGRTPLQMCAMPTAVKTSSCENLSCCASCGLTTAVGGAAWRKSETCHEVDDIECICRSFVAGTTYVVKLLVKKGTWKTGVARQCHTEWIDSSTRGSVTLPVTATSTLHSTVLKHALSNRSFFVLLIALVQPRRGAQRKNSVATISRVAHQSGHASQRVFPTRTRTSDPPLGLFSAVACGGMKTQKPSGRWRVARALC